MGLLQHRIPVVVTLILILLSILLALSLKTLPGTTFVSALDTRNEANVRDISPFDITTVEPRMIAQRIRVVRSLRDLGTWSKRNAFTTFVVRLVLCRLWRQHRLAGAEEPASPFQLIQESLDEIRAQLDGISQITAGAEVAFASVATLTRFNAELTDQVAQLTTRVNETDLEIRARVETGVNQRLAEITEARIAARVETMILTRSVMIHRIACRSAHKVVIFARLPGMSKDMSCVIGSTYLGYPEGYGLSLRSTVELKPIPVRPLASLFLQFANTNVLSPTFAFVLHPFLQSNSSVATDAAIASCALLCENALRRSRSPSGKTATKHDFISGSTILIDFPPVQNIPVFVPEHIQKREDWRSRLKEAHSTSSKWEPVFITDPQLLSVHAEHELQRLGEGTTKKVCSTSSLEDAKGKLREWHEQMTEPSIKKVQPTRKSDSKADLGSARSRHGDHETLLSPTSRSPNINPQPTAQTPSRNPITRLITTIKTRHAQLLAEDAARQEKKREAKNTAEAQFVKMIEKKTGYGAKMYSGYGQGYSYSVYYHQRTSGDVKRAREYWRLKGGAPGKLGVGEVAIGGVEVRGGEGLEMPD
ncbi:hypothetical protein BJ508DRAFT_350465 [Ascobolus immersus RN42]|uniref:Uncharacterized protein n=1 Tax=Ascobolus immersus RN42 TaxID=1160509 RepID=A0A3N4HUX7_ASCIM|nr:hypothetical protein BJ508DRAFT_350465 [Ascobolus immersus RN42]